MDLFETQSVINLEDTFKQLKKYAIPKRVKIFVFTIILVEVCIFIAAVLAKDYDWMIRMAVVIIVLISAYLFTLNRNIKIGIKKMHETVHTNVCEYTTSFCDAGFKIKNHVTNGIVTIAYDDINRFVEIKAYFVLFTKTNQFGVVNKSVIEEVNKREELINFLKHSCKNIRW